MPLKHIHILELLLTLSNSTTFKTNRTTCNNRKSKVAHICMRTFLYIMCNMQSTQPSNFITPVDTYELKCNSQRPEDLAASEKSKLCFLSCNPLWYQIWCICLYRWIIKISMLTCSGSELQIIFQVIKFNKIPVTQC